MNTILLLLAPVFPLLLAIGLMTGLLRQVTFRLAPWAALPALVLSLTSMADSKLELPWLLLGAQMGLDDTARYFMFFTSLLWLVAAIYTVGYLSQHAARARFFIWFLLAMTGNFGVILAQDLSLFYTFFALMSFASYGLVVHERTKDALRAGRIYIILVVVGEVLLFAAFALSAHAADSIAFDAVRQALATSEIRDWIIGLALLGFGIKTGVIGLHVWLPLAHPVAPTPASAVLSGAMIATGLLGWLRILPLGEVTLTGWGEILTIAGMASVYYAVLVGLMQNKAKTVLAYSSISKMGIMTVGIGLGLIAPQSWPLLLTAILIYATHHGLAKGALFLGVGMASSPPVSKIQRRLIIMGLLLPALSLAGAPFTSGMLAKQMFKLPMMSLTPPLLEYLTILFTLSAVATTLLMVRFLYLVWPKYEMLSENDSQPASMWWSWLFLLAAVVMSPVFIILIHPTLHLSMPILASALWPVVIGGVIAISVWLTTRHRVRHLWSLPPGDILVIVERWIYPLFVSVFSLAIATVSKGVSLLGSIGAKYANEKSVTNALDICENQLGRWAVALILFLIVGVITVALLL